MKSTKKLVKIGAMATVVVIFLVILAGIEMGLRITNRRPYIPSQIFLGANLETPDKWTQKDSADERGMNFCRPDYHWWDTLHHVNQQGFLARWNYDRQTIDSFKRAGYKIVFIIGDSFTEGVTSSTFDKTMCELLKHRLITDRYLVCPFGVGGTDLVQYRLVAEKFIPELKPDAVYIAFCSNDFADFNRIPTPHIAMYYQSNVGYLSTAIYNHVIPTKDSMYHFFRNTSPVISGPWIAQHSFIAAGIVAALFPRKYQWFPNDGYDTTVTARELARIHNVCAENKTPLVVCHIPDKNYFYSSAQEYAGIYGKGFGSMLPYVKFYDQGDMSSADYRKEDSHFSDSGNKKFADFLERQIRDTKIVSRIR